MEDCHEEEFENLFTKGEGKDCLVKAWEREKDRLNMNDEELFDRFIGFRHMPDLSGKIFKLKTNNT